MAKPKRNKNGSWHIMANFKYERRRLTLGLIDKKEAEHFAANLNRLIDHRRRYHGIPLPLQSWVTSLSEVHRRQLSELGLLSTYSVDSTIKDLIEDFLEYYDSRPETEVKQATKTSMRQALTNRIPRFLKLKTYRELEPTRPDDMPFAEPVFSRQTERLYIKVNSWQREHYALSSWSRANGRMQEFGAWCVKRGLCKFNAFTILPTPEQVNDDRNEYIDREWILDVMDNCLDPDTRLVLALGRFAGLRTPSECRRMKPSHVDFDAGELTIIGKGQSRPKRRMPLFDTVRTELQRHREATGWKRTVFTDRLLGKSDANNYSLILEAVNRAGYDLWPRLRQNLRSSCENDLLESGFSEREVVIWLGHTTRTSRKSYQKQTSTHLQTAISRARKVGM